MIERLVLDCSVAAKWCLPDEELMEAAEQVLFQCLHGRIELHAPDLIKYELGNVLTRAQRAQKPRLTRVGAEKAFQRFCSLAISFHPLSDTLLNRALLFANRFHRNFYDACYIQLAEELDCPWLTAERKFLGPLPPGFPTHRVRVLASLNGERLNGGE
jgi:predicted nucleic acid-binding protein